MPEGDRDDWSAEFPLWRQRFDERFETIRKVRLAVLVWGPGEHSPGYSKREAICEHLRAGNPGNEVATSEFLIRRDARFSELHPYEAEELQLDAADVAIVLIAPDQRATGARAEVAMFGLFSEFRDKLYLILPLGSDASGAFIDRGLARIPRERRFEYDAVELEDCTRIRSFCLDAVERVRADRGWRILRERRRL